MRCGRGAAAVPNGLGRLCRVTPWATNHALNGVYPRRPRLSYMYVPEKGNHDYAV